MPPITRRQRTLILELRDCLLECTTNGVFDVMVGTTPGARPMTIFAFCDMVDDFLKEME